MYKWYNFLTRVSFFINFFSYFVNIVSNLLVICKKLMGNNTVYNFNKKFLLTFENQWKRCNYFKCLQVFILILHAFKD